MDGRSSSSIRSSLLQSVCRWLAECVISFRLCSEQCELVCRQTRARRICRIIVCRILHRIGMANRDKPQEAIQSPCSSSLVSYGRRRWKGVSPIFWGVFAPQRPAMLRYARKRRGLCVEPPAESRPSPCGRGCQRLAVRSPRSRKSSPSLVRSLSMLHMALGMAACFTPRSRGVFFPLRSSSLRTRCRVAPLARKALAARRSTSTSQPVNGRSRPFTSNLATIGSSWRPSRRAGPCCRCAIARPNTPRSFP